MINKIDKVIEIIKIHHNLSIKMENEFLNVKNKNKENIDVECAIACATNYYSMCFFVMEFLCLLKEDLEKQDNK